MRRTIVCFDAGITHVGMVLAEADDDAWSNLRVMQVACVDLAAVEHRRVPRCECTLRHDKTLASRFAHFLQEHEATIGAATDVIVEQQPPGSAGQVFEQLLLFSVPRASTVHPRSVHVFHGYSHLEYDGRKQAAERVAAPLLEGCAHGSLTRSHDVADAVCILLFVAEKRRRAAAVRAAAPSVAALQRFAFSGPLPGRVGGRRAPPQTDAAAAAASK